ncbi:MAG: undecaprenyl-phosphate galactose phosphotransferase WbaP [Methylococcaceae bacterium]|nr:undecaprenyl-phosphate galactose phosphotransferase WbaP [Methylococcaceae bacterium]
MKVGISTAGIHFQARSKSTKHGSISKWLLMGSDALMLVAGFIFASSIRFLWNDSLDFVSVSIWANDSDQHIGIFGLLCSAIIGWFWLFRGHYTQRKPFWDELRDIINVLLLAALFDASFMYFEKWHFSRFSLGMTWLSAIFLLPSGRIVTKLLMMKWGIWQKPSLLLGIGDNALNAYRAMKSEPLLGYHFVAGIVLKDEDIPLSGYLSLPNKNLPVYSCANSEPRDFLNRFGASHVVLALDGEQLSSQQDLLHQLINHHCEVSLIPPLRGLPLYGIEAEHFFSHEVLLLRVRNNLDRRASRALKRLFDIVATSLGLLILFPFLIGVASIICLEDGFPVIFRQPRIGRHGHEFTCLKFRSMKKNAEQVLEDWKKTNPALRDSYEKNNFKLKNDPRLLTTGSWLRKLSIDELPQIWNVLMGEMSLVGPRPLLEREVSAYGESIGLYFATRPGITGLWQISGRSRTEFSDRARLDAWYVRNWSLWYDIVILMKTFSVVLKRDGAY